MIISDSGYFIAFKDSLTGNLPTIIGEATDWTYLNKGTKVNDLNKWRANFKSGLKLEYVWTKADKYKIRIDRIYYET